MSQWLLIGISGVTCGGKTTLANSICNYFLQNKDDIWCKSNIRIENIHIIHQDEYFLSINDPRQKWIPELNHINWEIPGSLDMDKMIGDIRALLGRNFLLYKKQDKSQQPLGVNILIVEGFLIFNYQQLLEYCQLKFHIHLPYEKCFQRRKTRIYDPPDVPGYFEAYVWPMYEKHFKAYKDRKDIIILNGEINSEKILNYCILSTMKIFE